MFGVLSEGCYLDPVHYPVCSCQDINQGYLKQIILSGMFNPPVDNYEYVTQHKKHKLINI